jgi:hypothetical protein
VPVVTTPPPLFVPIPTITLLVLSTVREAKVVVNGATAEVDIFVLVVDTLTEVLTTTGREVVPGGGGVEKMVV